MEESNAQDHAETHWAVEVKDGERHRLVDYQIRGRPARLAAINGGLRLFARDVLHHADGGSTTFGEWTEMALHAPEQRGPGARREFILGLLREAGDDGLTTKEVGDAVEAAGLTSRRQTVYEDLGMLRGADLVEQRPGVWARWFLVANAVEDPAARQAGRPGQPRWVTEARKAFLRGRVAEMAKLVRAGVDEEAVHVELRLAQDWLAELEHDGEGKMPGVPGSDVGESHVPG